MANTLDSRAKEFLKIGGRMFSQKEDVDSLWQELALNFYPQRADFTEKRSWGEEFSDHLFSSLPVIARREMGNAVSAHLRPQNKRWVSLHDRNKTIDEDQNVRGYLEYCDEIMWRAMYDPRSKFVRATKQCDHDFVTFGNGCLEVSTNLDGDTLLFRNWHLRDCAWSENVEGDVDNIHRRWKPTARQLKERFGDAVSNEVKKMCEKDPEHEVECVHVHVPSRIYDYKSKGGKRFPFVHLYIEKETETVLEEVGAKHFRYVVPRWQNISGNPYARSMCTEICLPDGRTMQVVMRTLREAGEKFVDPPMIAIADAIRGDMPLYAGGVTIAEMEYDERLGEVLRPITQNSGNMPIGFEIAQALRADIESGFFLNRLQLPETGAEMTAFEVRRRIEEHMRSQAPIFEPVEESYNMNLLDTVYTVLAENGAFPFDKMPEVLADRELKFKFRSPLSEMADQAEASIFQEGMTTIVAPAAQIDPAQLRQVNLTKGVRASLTAIGFKAEWLNPEEDVEAEREKLRMQLEQQQQMEQVAQVGEVAKTGGEALGAIANAVT